MAEDAKIKLILDTHEALQEAKNFAPQLQKALTVNAKGTKADKIQQALQGNIKAAGIFAKVVSGAFSDYEKVLDRIAPKAERIKELNEQMAFGGKMMSDMSQAKRKGSITTDTGEVKTYADLRAEWDQAKAERATLLTDIETELKALPESLDTIKDDAQKVASEGTKFKSEIEQINKTVGNLKPTTKAASGSGAKPVIKVDTEEARGEIEELVREIYSLRVQGKDTSLEFSQLSRKLMMFDTAKASVADLSRFMGDVDSSIKYIKKDLEGTSTLDDVFEKLKISSIEAAKANSNFNAEVKRGISDEQRAANAVFSLVTAYEQEKIAAQQAREQEAFEQAYATTQHQTAAVYALTAAYRQVREEQKAEEAEARQAKQEQQTRDEVNAVYALVAAYRQVKEEQKAQQEAAIAQQNAARVQSDTSWVLALTSAANQYNETINTVVADVNRLDRAINQNPASDNIAELVRRLNALKEAKSTLEGLGIPQGTDATYNTIVRLLDDVNQKIKQYKTNMADVSSDTRTFGSEAKKAEKDGVSFATRVSQATATLKRGMSTVHSILSSVRQGFQSLSKATQRVGGSFNGLGRSAKSNFKHMLSNITKYVFGFRSLFFLIRRLRKYLGEGIQDLVKYEKAVGKSKMFDSVNQSITRLKSSLLFLEHAWAAAFAPIITAVTPMLTKLIDSLAVAGNTVAKFIGVLTGQKVVYNAVKTPAKDYADSLDKAGSSAGKAAKNQKKLNDRLAAFDDLIVLGKDKDTDPNNTGSGGGAGNNADDTDYSKLFKRVKAVSDLANKIKEAIKNGFDFTEVGSYVSDGLVKALHNIQWGKIKQQAHNIGYGIGTFITGFFKNDQVWQEVGRTIAQGINTATKFVEGLLKGTKSLNLGGGLAALLNRMFGKDGVDWDTINKNIKEFVTQVVNNITNFLNGLKWEDIKSAVFKFGQTFGSIISSTLGNAEFMKALGEGLGNILDSFFTAWQGALDATNGDAIGEAIYKFFSGIIGKVKWDKVAQDLSGSLILLLDAISKFSEELSKDTSFQQALIDFVSNLNLDGVFAALGRNISSSTVAANTIGATFATVLGDRGVAEQVTGGISALIGNLKVADMISSMITFLGNLIGGALSDPLLPLKLLGAILEGLEKAIGDWIIENNKDAEGNVQWGESMGWFIVQGIWNGISKAITELFGAVLSPFIAIEDSFCELFDINSPSKVAEGWGEYLVEGIINGINNLIDRVMEPFTKLKEDLSTKWSEITGNAWAKWDSFKTMIIGKALAVKNDVLLKFGELRDNVAKVWSSIAGVAYAKWDNIKTVLVNAVNAIKVALKTPINGIIGIVEGMVNKVISGLNSMFSKLKSVPDFKVTNPFNGKEYKLSLNLPTIKNVSIPRLAQGAVIPPNREFMAVLGDQSHGTNVEAPLDTIKQAVAEVLANNGNAEVIQLLRQLIGVVESKNLTIGDKEIAKANARYTNQQRIIRGASY